MTCSTTACSRCSASAISIASVRLVRNEKCRRSGHSSACAPIRRVRLTIKPGAAIGGFGDLCLARFGVVDALPGALADRVDGGPDLLDVAHAHRVLPAGPLQALKDRGVPESRVGPEQLHAAGTGPVDARDQFLAEAQHPFL